MMHDLRSAIRALRTRRGSSILALICLSVGIATNTMVFSIVNGLLLRDLPLAESERLVHIQERSREDPANPRPVSYEAFLDLGTRAADVIDIAAERRAGLRVSDPGAVPERESGSFVSWNLFASLGVRPVLGRDFVDDDDRPAAAPVVIVSHGFWQQRYAGDPSILGRIIIVNGTPHAVVGVMPQELSHPALRGLFGVRLWVPLAQMDAGAREQTSLRVVGRLRPGVSVASARARLGAVTPSTSQHQVGAIGAYAVEPLRIGFSAGTQGLIATMMGAVSFVLLIACVNVANLTLARTASRRHELATRLALGASRSRLVRQLVIESLIVAMASVPPGILLARWGRTLLIGRTAGPEVYEATSIDISVLLFSVGLAVLASLLSGLLPAWHAVRRLHVEFLRAGGRSEATAGPGHSILSRVLIAAEVALAVILLVGAAVFLKSFRTTLGAEGGFDTSHILTLRVETVQDGKAPDDASLERVFAILDRLQALPSVEHVAAANLMPLRDAGARASVMTDVPSQPTTPPVVLVGGVTAAFFDVLGVAVVQGRALTEAEGRSLAPVAVINRRMAQRLWPGENPVGRRFRPLAAGNLWFTVIGVSENILNWDISDRPQPTAYVPYPHVPDRDPRVLLRTVSDPVVVVQPARGAVNQAAPGTPVLGVLPMTEVHHMALGRNQTLAWLFATLGVIALLLGATGVYGVLSYFVTQRTAEIGIRAALGADARGLVLMFVRQGLAAVAIGLGIGLPAAWAVARVLRGRLYNVSPPDPLILSAVTLLLLLVAFTAAYVPARRAAAVDPLVALRR